MGTDLYRQNPLFCQRVSKCAVIGRRLTGQWTEKTGAEDARLGGEDSRFEPPRVCGGIPVPISWDRIQAASINAASLKHGPSSSLIGLAGIDTHDISLSPSPLSPYPIFIPSPVVLFPSHARCRSPPTRRRRQRASGRKADDDARRAPDASHLGPLARAHQVRRPPTSSQPAPSDSPRTGTSPGSGTL